MFHESPRALKITLLVLFVVALGLIVVVILKQRGLSEKETPSQNKNSLTIPVTPPNSREEALDRFKTTTPAQPQAPAGSAVTAPASDPTVYDTPPNSPKEAEERMQATQSKIPAPPTLPSQ